jgi:hypothetical protein
MSCVAGQLRSLRILNAKEKKDVNAAAEGQTYSKGVDCRIR